MSKEANGNPLIVDSDAHVVECDRTWDYLEASERQFRPVPLASPEGERRLAPVLAGGRQGAGVPLPGILGG